MKTLENIKPEHLFQFNKLIQQGLNRPYFTDDPPISLLEWAREHNEQYLDELVKGDDQCDLFSNEIPHVHLIALQGDIDTDFMQLSDCEPDHIYVSICFKQQYGNGIEPTEENMPLLFTLVMLIMLSDCTGCCDAMDYITVSRGGIFASGQIGSTYHS